MRVLICCIICAFALNAKAQTCAFLDDWRALKAGITSSADVGHSQALIWEARNEAAEKVFDLYINGQLAPGTLDQCMPDNDEREDFQLSVPQIFFERSLRILESASSPGLKKLTTLVRMAIAHTHLEVFRLIGHRAGSSIGKETFALKTSAAFNRSTHSIYMDLDRIPPNEWLINFCHELSHAVDERMPIAMSIFADEKIARAFSDLSSRISDPNLLTPSDKRLFDGWLIAALDRGLLGEYRAWTVTLSLYIEGKKAHLWQPIESYEKWLSIRRPGESLASVSMRHLDPAFLDPDPFDPEAGIFSRPLIQAELKNVRSSIRVSLQPLYNLGSFVSN